MSIGVIVNLDYKPGLAKPTIEMMKERLPFARSYDGCEMLEMYVDHDNPDHLVLVERWASRAHYDKYLEWAMAQSDTEDAMQTLERPMAVQYLDETGA